MLQRVLLLEYYVDVVVLAIEIKTTEPVLKMPKWWCEELRKRIYTPCG